ncbi:hypothetical protein SCUCBS95973_001627 [Sporothrix curviconia]|uniref:Uncharacterized protein n=1 Tax=Sporothrix curviconia TaxID=1260050 RepID=A0ABP0B0T9_9PEZI
MPAEIIRNDPPGSSRNCGEFFSWFETVYGGDRPGNAIFEINGCSPDINRGHGGEFVWLIPHKASSPHIMADNIWVDIRDSSDGDRDDLAKGAGGDYRYLSWTNNMNATHFITDIALWRAADKKDSPPENWHHKSDDINRGRGGDYLYLVWRTKQYCF